MKLVPGMESMSKKVTKASKMELVWGLVAVMIDVLVLRLVLMMESNLSLMMDLRWILSDGLFYGSNDGLTCGFIARLIT